jgi:hypothetical protein
MKLFIIDDSLHYRDTEILMKCDRDGYRHPTITAGIVASIHVPLFYSLGIDDSACSFIVLNSRIFHGGRN